MQVKLVWRHFNVKFVFKYDRNTVVNILKKQGVPAPWVIIHLMHHSSHILRTTESLIILICEFHSTIRLKIHFLWQKYSTEINKTEWSWRHSFRITYEQRMTVVRDLGPTWGKISSQPHSTLCIQFFNFLPSKTMTKTIHFHCENRFVLQ